MRGRTWLASAFIVTMALDGCVRPRYSQELIDAHREAFTADLTKFYPCVGADHDDVPELLPLATYRDDLTTALAAIPPATPAQ